MKNTNWMVGGVRGLAAVGLMVMIWTAQVVAQVVVWNGAPPGNNVNIRSDGIRIGSGVSGTYSIANNNTANIGAGIPITSDNAVIVTTGIGISSGIATTYHWNASLLTTSNNVTPLTFGGNTNSTLRITSGTVSATTGHAISITGSATLDVDGGIISATTGNAINAANNLNVRVSSGLVVAQGTSVSDVIRTSGTGTLTVSSNATVVAYTSGEHSCDQFTSGAGLHRHLSGGEVFWDVREINGDVVTGIRYGGDQFFALPIGSVTFTHVPDETKPSTCTEPQRCKNCKAIVDRIDPTNHKWSSETVDRDPTCTTDGGAVQVCEYNSAHVNATILSIPRLNCQLITWHTNGGLPLPEQTHVVTHSTPSYSSPTVISEPDQMIRSGGYSFAGWYNNSSFTGTRVPFPVTNVTTPPTFWARWNDPVFGISLTNGAVPLIGTTHNFGNVEFGNEQTPLTVTVSNTGTLPTGGLTVELSGAGFTLSSTSLTAIPVGSETRTFTVTPNNNLNLATYTATVTVRPTTANAEIPPRTFTVTFTLTRASRTDIPTEIGTTNASPGGNDGALTGVNLSTMEWRRTGTSLWSSASPTGLAMGTYEVRYRETDTHLASSNVVTVTIGESAANFLITVIRDPEAGGTASAAPSSAAADTEITLTASAETGYTFSGWASNDVIIADNKFTMPAKAVTVTANFTPDNYNVTWNADGGTPEPTRTTVDHGDNINAPAAMTRDGHTFGGWFTDAGFTTSAEFPITATGAMTFWAKWTPNKYTVTFTSNGGSDVSPIANVPHNETINAPFPAPTKTGHTFGGWYKEEALTNLWNFATDNVTSNTTLFAKWTPNTYTVVFNGSGSDGGSMTGQSFTYGTAQNLTANAFTKTGYTFTGWAESAVGAKEYDGGEEVNNLTDVNGGTVNLYAVWNPAPLIGTAEISGSAVFGQTLKGSLVDGNNTGTLTYTWKTGATVLKTGTGADDTYVIAAAAVGQTITLEITSSIQTGGPITIAMAATVAKAPGPAAPSGLGQTNASVYGASDGTITGVTTDMEWQRTTASTTDWADVENTELTGLTAGTYEVRFKETNTHLASPIAAITITQPAQTFTLTVNTGANGGVSVTPSGQNHTAGTSVIVTATPDNDGYRFKEWTVTGVTITGGNTANPATFNMPSGAVTLTADFEPAPLTGTAAITGTPTVGQQLTGSLTGSHNHTGTTLTYIWKTGETELGRGENYTIQPEDFGKRITLEIESDIQTKSVTSVMTAEVASMVVTITPNNEVLSKVYGTPDPAFTYTNSAGLPPGTFDGLLSREGEEGSDVGTYAFDLGTLVSANPAYTLKMADGAVFTITKAAITISSQSVNLMTTNTSEQSKSLAVLVETYKSEGDILTFAVLPYTGAAGIIEPGANAAGGTLKFSLSGTGSSSQAATIPVLISGFKNYNDVTVYVTITLTEKEPDESVKVTAPQNITYGEVLGDPSATADYGDEFDFEYIGTGSTTYPITETKPTLPGSYEVIATLRSTEYAGSDVGTFTIYQKPLTWNSGATIHGRPYDRSYTAVVNNQPTLNGVIVPDNVTVKMGTAAFNSSYANPSVAVTASGYDIEGIDSWKYTAPASQPVFANAAITPVSITITGVSAVDRAWNGETTVALTSGTLQGVLTDDVSYVGFTLGSGEMENADVGEDKDVEVTGIQLTLARAGNYTLTQPTGIKVDIFKAENLNKPTLVYSISGDFPKTVTITSVAGAEYSFNEGAYSEVNTFTSHVEEEVVLRIRFAQTDTHEASGYAEKTANTGNESQDPPEDFTLSVIANSDVNYTVTIPATYGAEYKFDIDGVMAQDWSSVNTITALPAQTVKGYKRLAAKPGFSASDSVEDEIALPLFIVKTPEASPNGGTFTALSQIVTLSTTTAGADIYYTLDGSTPTISDELLYTEPFELTAPITATVKAIAVKTGMANNDVMSVTFTINTPTYAVKWNADGGTPAPEPITVTHGDNITEPEAMTRTGYVFGGWFSDAGFTTPVTFPIEGVTGAREFWAKWTINKYTVSFSSNGGSSVGDIINVEHGSTITAPSAPALIGHTFGGWYREAALTNLWVFAENTVVADTALYAKWTINNYPVTWNADGGTSVPAQVSVNHGASITAPAAMTKTGYTFAGWFSDEDLTDAIDFPLASVTEAQAFYAKWTLISYAVKWNADGGTPAPSQTTVNHGAIITAPLSMSKAGYDFGGWFSNAEFTTPVTFPIEDVTGEREFWAKWTEKINTPVLTDIKFLSPKSSGNGNVSPSEPIDVADVSSYIVEIAAVDQLGAVFIGGAPVRIYLSVRIGNAATTRILNTGTSGVARFEVSLAGSVTGNEALFTARAEIGGAEVSDTARLAIVRTVPVPMPAGGDRILVTDSEDDAPDTNHLIISVNDRVYPGEIQPVNLGKSQFIAGPNVVKKGETVKIFREGKSIKNGVLMIYDASGDMVGKISISEHGGAARSIRTGGAHDQSRRVVGSWNLKDTKGRLVSEGTYLVRGVVVASDGNREKISLMIGVR